MFLRILFKIENINWKTLITIIKVLEMVTESLFVQWFGPYCFAGSESENVFTNSIGEKKGVYLWTIPFDSKYLVYYVGETGVSFAERLLQHVQSYLNGFYRVFDPEEFAEGRKVLVWGGMWKSDRKSPDIMFEYLRQYHKLSDMAHSLLNQFRIFVAPLKENDRRIRQRIEAAIAYGLL